MIHFRVRVDVDNLRLRLSRASGRMVGEPETIDWLASHGIVLSPPSSCEFLSTERALQALEPWEILQRLPLIILPQTSTEQPFADVR